MARMPRGHRPEHGTSNRYVWELRHDGKACPECKEAWRLYIKNYRASKKGSGPEDTTTLFPDSVRRHNLETTS